MTDKLLRVVWVDQPGASVFTLPDAGAWGPFTTTSVQDLSDQPTLDAVAAADLALVCLPASTQAVPIPWAALSSVCDDTAVLVLADSMDAATQERLLNTGVQDVVLETDASSLAQRARLAVQRKQVDVEARKAYATDLGTGLPNRQQLIEHMSQLLALREREPKPVSVLALRIDGLQGVEAGHGVESANVVRRKIAVRLRAGVRASDVVASLGGDVFGVLLPSIESATDAEHVVQKLLRALREPIKIAGTAVPITAHVGVAHFPEDGRQPTDLLRHAS
ncbi:MAG: diguanylate cyclase, partial [Rhizobacter sp.]